MVLAWFPQMNTSSIFDAGTPERSAICPTARFWSSLVIAVNCRGGILGAFAHAIRALVLHGLPTVIIFTFVEATASIAFPCPTNIGPFAATRSDLSMSLVLGREPTRKITSASLNATFGSSVPNIPRTSGNAESFNSIITPSRRCIPGGISSSCNVTGWFIPKQSPLAILHNSAYPILPAAPVTATRIDFFIPSFAIPTIAISLESVDTISPRASGSDWSISTLRQNNL